MQASSQEEEDILIYNYPTTYTGKVDLTFKSCNSKLAYSAASVKMWAQCFSLVVRRRLISALILKELLQHTQCQGGIYLQQQ